MKKTIFGVFAPSYHKIWNLNDYSVDFSKEPAFSMIANLMEAFSADHHGLHGYCGADYGGCSVYQSKVINLSSLLSTASGHGFNQG